MTKYQCMLMHVDLDKPWSIKDLSKHKDIAIIHKKERWITWMMTPLLIVKYFIEPVQYHCYSIATCKGIWTPGWTLTCLALKIFKIWLLLTVLGILIDFWLVFDTFIRIFTFYLFFTFSAMTLLGEVDPNYA